MWRVTLGGSRGGETTGVDVEGILARIPADRETVGVELARQICQCGHLAGLRRDWSLSYTRSLDKEVKLAALAQHLRALGACFRGEAPVLVMYWWDGTRAQLRVTPLAGSPPNEQTAERRPRLP